MLEKVRYPSPPLSVAYETSVWVEMWVLHHSPEENSTISGNRTKGFLGKALQGGYESAIPV